MLYFLAFLAGCTEIGLNDSSKPPEVTLISPVDGGRFTPGEDLMVCAAVDFTGDLELLQGSLVSDIDGTLATTGFGDCDGGDLGITVQLSDATHVLALTFTDAQGRAGSDSATVYAGDNVAPTCWIVAPDDNTIYPVGETVIVTARVDDEDGGPIDVVLDSTVDGELGTQTIQDGANVEFSFEPTPGEHDLVITAQDDRREVGICVLSISVVECTDADGDEINTCEGDCDDHSSDTFPGASEVPDGQDNDCDGTVDEGTVLFDDDGDGVNELDGDCDDTSADINPSATDIPDNGVDEDCSEADAVTCFVDSDNDQYGISTTLIAADGDCFDPGEAPVSGDCDDADASRNPGAAEIPADGVDQDCNGVDPAGCFEDSDGDGFGSSTILPLGDGDCNDPGESNFGTDCDDQDPSRYPGAFEVLDDGLDQDCSGSDRVTCYADADGDGYGGPSRSPEEGTCVIGEDAPTDCDDAASGIHPGATEIPDNGVDEDCNGVDATECYHDGDLDGFGSTQHVVGLDGSCDTADSESTNNNDCDDTDQSIHPGAPEIPDDLIDQDCDGTDAHSTPTTELLNGIDDNGDGRCDEGLIGPGALIITEFMFDPDHISDSHGEYFELYNTTGTEIRLCEDWKFFDNGSDTFFIQDESVVVAPGGYLVIARDGNPATNGGIQADAEWGSLASNWALSNGGNGDEIIVEFDGVEIDRVEYNSWTSSGFAAELMSSAYSASDNDIRANWCASSTPLNANNFGTPGAPNSCP